jgi:hypothetical protein
MRQAARLYPPIFTTNRPRNTSSPGYTPLAAIATTHLRRYSLLFPGEFKSKIWIATDNAIVTCPLDSVAFTMVDDKFISQDDVPVYFLTNQAITTSSAIWFLSSKGPYYIEDDTTIIHRYNKRDLPIFKYPWYASIYADGDSILYFTTFHYDGIYTLQAGYSNIGFDSIYQCTASQRHMDSSLCRLNENELMGTSENSGVFTFNTKTGKSKFFIPDITNPNSLGSNHGDQIIIDTDGVISWQPTRAWNIKIHHNFHLKYSIHQKPESVI